MRKSEESSRLVACGCVSPYRTEGSGRNEAEGAKGGKQEVGGGKGQKEEKERGESPESNKPAKIEVTLKLLHG